MDIAGRALQLGFEVTKFGFRIGIGTAKAVLGLVTGGHHQEPAQAQPAAHDGPVQTEQATAAGRPSAQAAAQPRPARQAAPARPAPRERVNGAGTTAPAPLPRVDVPAAPAAAEDEPEPVHIDDEPELVGEFAEEGAEDGAHAELRVDEPWPNYRRMRVADVRERIALADTAQLAVVQLYESTHKNRKSILDAVERRNRALANEPQT